MSRPMLKFNFHIEHYVTIPWWSKFDLVVQISPTVATRVKRVGEIVGSTLPKTRGDEWRRIDSAINEREGHFPWRVRSTCFTNRRAACYPRESIDPWIGPFDRLPAAFTTLSIGANRVAAAVARWTTRRRGKARVLGARRVTKKMKIDEGNANGSAASASTWRLAGWQLGSHRHFDFAFLGTFARLGAPLLRLRHTWTRPPTPRMVVRRETRPRTLPSAAPPCFFALSKPGSAPLLPSFSACVSIGTRGTWKHGTREERKTNENLARLKARFENFLLYIAAFINSRLRKCWFFFPMIVSFFPSSTC